MHEPHWWAVGAFLLDWLIRIGLSARIIMRRLPVGVSLAWMFVVLAFPFFGAVIYLVMGEPRLGRRRAIRYATLEPRFLAWLSGYKDRIDRDYPASTNYEPIIRLGERLLDLPAVGGNQVELLGDWQRILKSLIADIDAAKQSCHLEFYIWHPGGMADDVAAALLRAAERGVACRVLLDDLGSREFWNGEWPGRLKAGGVRLQRALPTALWRMIFSRADLRLHRKIAVMDGSIAYTGSLNLVDPRYFKQDSGVGEWVDAMIRVRGPVVEAFSQLFLADWLLEGGEPPVEPTAVGAEQPMMGTAGVQVLASGPARQAGHMERVLISAIYYARRDVTLTTPYFVPDEQLLSALASAAGRGVRVTLIVPARVDSTLVRLASSAFLGDLAEAGVRVLLYGSGLLHTKSMTVDGELCFFGSLNLDPRSLNLNFEVTAAVYDRQFAAELGRLQASYAEQSQPMDLQRWLGRSAGERFVENAARLFGPLI